MVLKTSLKMLAFLLVLYSGWYVFNFLSAWLGIAIIIASIVGVGVYLESGIKNIFNKKD